MSSPNLDDTLWYYIHKCKSLPFIIEQVIETMAPTLTGQIPIIRVNLIGVVSQISGLVVAPLLDTSLYFV